LRSYDGVAFSYFGVRECLCGDVGGFAGVARFNLENDDAIGSVAIQGLGTGVGRLAPEEAASQMRDALELFLEEAGD
jgi:hypothetical protein